MDNIFDLEDFDDKIEENNEIVTTKPEIKNLYGIKEEEEKKYAVPDIIENNDDSFECKKMNYTTSELLPNQKNIEKKIYAIDDKIDIMEYNKIEPAITFNFELDIFQKRSIIRLEKHENVLVCAHTSSGKTVIAEYAIALGKKIGKRVFYTSPIKALSNQKYREFKEKFNDVGILTGDVSMNSDAQCVIMTTEILQSSLYKNSEMLNSVEWVIFDEVHYINDNERGHVWEEILILLPPKIGIVMLSATIPNYLDFAKWVGRIKNCTIYIQNTLKRIVPLEHKAYINKKNVFIIKTPTDDVKLNNIHKAIESVEIESSKQQNSKLKGDNQYDRKQYEQKMLNQMREKYKGVEKLEKEKFNKKNNYKGEKNTITRTHLKIQEIIKHLSDNNLTPAVIFVFSIKKIDDYAKFMGVTDSLVSKDESHKILNFYDRCMSILNENDRNIAQIQLMRRILPQGIGVHHAGLLPILKETIEILYSHGLLKVLFATTSFSIGLNMPTRTVVFSEIEKFNDEKKQILSTSEYLQMCGRAGRRGIDTIGHIFLLLGDKTYPPKADDLREMLSGTGDVVESKFRLSYKTIISFLSRNIKDIFEFFKESYLENQKLLIMPETVKKQMEIKDQLQAAEKIQCHVIGESDDLIKEYYNLSTDYKKIRKKLYLNDFLISKLTPGRIISINSKKLNKDIFVMVIWNYREYDNELRCILAENNKKLVIEYEQSEKDNNSGVHKDIYYRYIQMNVEDIIDIYDFTIKVDRNDYIEDKEFYMFINKKTLDRILNDLIDVTVKHKPKILDYNKICRNDVLVYQNYEDKKKIQTKIENSPCHSCYQKNNHIKIYERNKELQDKYLEYCKILNEENLKYFSEFKKRIQFLKNLEYIDQEEQIKLKGKAAREISSTDCVMVSELLLSNILENLNISETVAFLSGFVYSKNEIELTDPDISDNFSEAVTEFTRLYEKIKKIEIELEQEENKYNRRVTFEVSKSVFLWMEGKSFKDILQECDLEEGKLYNLIMRLFLFLDEIKNFYEIIGSNACAKFVDAKGKLMRDIISCRSLYLQEDINIKI